MCCFIVFLFVLIVMFLLQLIVQFEQALANITVPNDELRDPHATYNPYTPAEVFVLDMYKKIKKEVQ